MSETNTIKITSDYRIVKTRHAWVVEKKADKVWEVDKTFISLESLLHGMADHLARQDTKSNILKSFEKANSVMIEVINQNSELILTFCNNTSNPVVRESNTKLLNLISGGT